MAAPVNLWYSEIVSECSKVDLLKVDLLKDAIRAAVGRALEAAADHLESALKELECDKGGDDCLLCCAHGGHVACVIEEFREAAKEASKGRS